MFLVWMWSEFKVFLSQIESEEKHMGYNIEYYFRCGLFWSTVSVWKWIDMG